MWSLDIETTSALGFPNVDDPQEEVLLITLQDMNTKDIITFGAKSYTPKQKNVNYIECTSEYDLLSRFMAWWTHVYPDVVTGWNISGFDIPYLVTRIERVLGEKQKNSLSPWNRVNRRISHDKTGREFTECTLLGINILDYMNIYKSPVLNAKNCKQESFRLDYIANLVLGVGKLDNPYNTFLEFYTNDWELFVDYNIRDTELVSQLEDECSLIELIFLMAYDSHACYEDCELQVRLWDVIIYNHLNKDNIVVPLLVRDDKSEKFEGAYVKEPIPGSYDWVVSYDLTSLYPSIIRLLNISPETLQENRHPSINVQKLLDRTVNMTGYEDYAVAANGSLYRKDFHGFMPRLINKVFQERKMYKNKMLECQKEYQKNPSDRLKKQITHWNNFQMARKICANSLYGALGNNFFRHYKLANAEAVTTTGQYIIKTAEKEFNNILNKMCGTTNENYVVAVDTDSNYLNLGPLMNKVFGDNKPDTDKMIDILDKFCEDKLSPYIADRYREVAEYLNAYENTLHMKRECISNRAVWTAKKRYIMNVYDDEGVRLAKPKLKVMGIECVRSSTPTVVRGYIKKGLEIIMNNTESDLIQFIEQKRNEFMQLSIEDVASPRTVNNMDKFTDPSTLYKKSTPQHVRAALLHNLMVRKLNISNKYMDLRDGDKMKFVRLLIPNPLKEDVIGFANEWPNEFGLDKWVDYPLMFEKTFLDPIKSILSVVGWSTEKKSSLEDFFS
jgi:DNA polymerase elongation subunit (family B)